MQVESSTLANQMVKSASKGVQNDMIPLQVRRKDVKGKLVVNLIWQMSLCLLHNSGFIGYNNHSTCYFLNHHLNYLL